MRALRRPPFVIAALLPALTLTLTACGDDETIPPPETVTVTQTPTASETPEPRQRQLTADEITAALPGEDDAPKGYRPDSRGFDSSTPSQRTTDPEGCIALYMSTAEQRTFDTEHGVADGGTRFTQNQREPGSPSISIAVWSYDEPYPDTFFDQAGAALAECQKFSARTAPDEAPSDWAADAIPTPTLGDQSFGVRIGNPEFGRAIDYLWVRSGHNLVHARMLTSYDQSNDTRLQRYTQLVLDNLDTTP